MKNSIVSAALAVSLIVAAPAALAIDSKGLVAQKVAVITKLHKKASKALVNAAQDQGYIDYMASAKADRHEHQPRIDKVSLKVQEKFHVEEMCLIDANGPELARIVGKEVANDLSPDESGAVFFKPGFALKPKKAYISPVYMSPDANKWVLAYVTPVVVDGDNKAILHYEHGLEVYQTALNKGVKDQWVLAVTSDGFIVSDSRKAIPVGKQGDNEDEANYFSKFSVDGKNLNQAKDALDKNSTLSIAGATYSGAYKQVEDWTIFALKSE